MSSGRHVFLILLFAVAGAALAYLLHDRWPNDISLEMGAIAGGFLFVIGCLIVLNLRQRATIRQCADIMGQMNEAMGEAIRDQRRVEEVLDSMNSALSTLEAEPNRNVVEVVAEVKVLQTLIEQLYKARGSAAQPAPVAAAPNLRVQDNPTPPKRETPVAPEKTETRATSARESGAK